MLFHSIPVHLTCFCYLNFSDTGLNIAFFALYGLLRIVCFCRCLFDVKSTWYTGNPMSSFAFRHCYQCKFHGCLWHNKNAFLEEAKHRTSLGKSTDVLHRKYGCLPQRSPMFLFSGTSYHSPVGYELMPSQEFLYSLMEPQFGHLPSVCKGAPHAPHT